MKAVVKLLVSLFVVASISLSNGQQTTVIINLTEQAAYLVENGHVAFISPIASGRDGWRTPTGNFRVIRKDLNHQSGDFGLICDSRGRIVNPNATPGSAVPPGCHYLPAPMPCFMEFRKYFGMHAGFLPGYPASHGCVRMPGDMAAEFFARVQVGTPVKIYGDAKNVSHVRKAISVIQPGNSERLALGRRITRR